MARSRGILFIQELCLDEHFGVFSADPVRKKKTSRKGTIVMKRPNFFIIGAPKCGTTSLATWLGDHKSIYVSPVKEPNYFNTDHVGPKRRSHLYESLFAAATAEHLAVGEATVWYLYSMEAVPNILKYNPNALFISCLRNPVEMAYSLHDQKVFNGFENVADFTKAWALNDERMSGRSVTPWCKESTQLAYANVCQLGNQVHRLLTHVPRDRVHFVFLDDVIKNPRDEYVKVLGFLSVDDDMRCSFPIIHPAKERKWPRLNAAITALNETKRRVGLGPFNLGISRLVDTHNRVERTRKRMSTEFRKELQRYFADDVMMLGRAVERDLSSWLRT